MGDPHGGTVTAGANEHIVDGRPVARKGDTVECKEHRARVVEPTQSHRLWVSAAYPKS